MTKNKTKDSNDYRISPDPQVVDVDLDDEPVSLPDGTVLDEAAAERYGRAVADRAAARRRPGRPSLTGTAAHSPHVNARVTPELREAIDDLATAQGVPASEVVRKALEEYVASHAG